VVDRNCVPVPVSATDAKREEIVLKLQPGNSTAQEGLRKLGMKIGGDDRRLMSSGIRASPEDGAEILRCFERPREVVQDGTNAQPALKSGSLLRQLNSTDSESRAASALA